MPMQPNPRAETSRLLLPSFRFCIGAPSVITTLPPQAGLHDCRRKPPASKLRRLLICPTLCAKEEEIKIRDQLERTPARFPCGIRECSDEDPRGVWAVEG